MSQFEIKEGVAIIPDGTTDIYDDSFSGCTSLESKEDKEIIRNMTKLLTKSLFTTALECPRKLYYAVHGNEYDNANSNNDFLRSLAEGGIQVGALARHYYKEAD